MAQVVSVNGLAEMQRAFRKLDKGITKEIRGELREAGDIVRDDARPRFAGISAKSAAGFRTVVRQRGVAVEQRHGRTTGKRPDFGALQLRRALVPALDAKEGEVVDQLDGMLGRLGGEAGF